MESEFLKETNGIAHQHPTQILEFGMVETRLGDLWRGGGFYAITLTTKDYAKIGMTIGWYAQPSQWTPTARKIDLTPFPTSVANSMLCHAPFSVVCQSGLQYEFTRIWRTVWSLDGAGSLQGGPVDECECCRQLPGRLWACFPQTCTACRHEPGGQAECVVCRALGTSRHQFTMPMPITTTTTTK
jgi:hypothetical protein